MTNGIPKDGIFYPILTQIMDSFPCPPLNIAFLIFKKDPEVSDNAGIQPNVVTSLEDNSNVT